ncbi:MAG: alpha/beta hydrolase [Nitrospirae bacterium CG_4_10_14_3_um_filter_44_29]|nr:alpha/beta hydrolase [Nitrospirota bacterium]OIO31948.1 MAG: alpha/beta hydrolase [Nitrospirae bacterium CG1_02_44_142]PIP70842.1 MAG: alpha/beta hydrolase [Nitrospirae bacterium CG22_combo_CG10-13_8_21_14_all_44_11]PIV42690.1 MAG: alpha/beta hydrolase [Nitrospirae bacterium CG02_land_8_20_14_3_00_44_33]PIV65445.1 MAG: alpha/beta hydrolase [Nitrospirae bacterium CG01_land_8_20_14_3_00_44_22]PIW89117.1 MAG: alpha/beta hydrolase [Nitrospirae bacterium CG_4_8_14_3_um_filter_44_28]PIX87762.1 M
MLYTILIGLALGYLLLIGFVYLRQGSMVYYPTKEIEGTPADIGLKYEEITLKTKDSVNLSAWYVPAKDERGVVLFCHGNAGNISHRLDSIRIFHDLGLSVFIFDYRGYGRSEGSATEKGTYLDAESAWEYLVNVKGARPEKIILFGRSLGSAVAAELALKHKAAGIIIESGFKTIPALGAKFFPYLPLRLISRFQYSTIDKVGMIKMPKLFIHSPQDEMIPYEHGAALFKNATEPKEFLQITGGHNEGFLTSGKIYTEGLGRFIAKAISP